MEKTNVMRILDQKKLDYKAYSYPCKEALSGMEIAKALGHNPNMVFKTLVTVSASKKNYVFVVPATCELDLKKAARAVGEKKIEMLKAKELLPLTGYVHGGCSPIGMKRFLKTTIDASAKNFETIIFSAGKIGCQVEMSISELEKAISFSVAEITE